MIHLPCLDNYHQNWKIGFALWVSMTKICHQMQLRTNSTGKSWTHQLSSGLSPKCSLQCLFLINFVRRLSPPEMRDIWRNIINHVLPIEKSRYIKKVLLLHELKKVNKNNQQKQLIRVREYHYYFLFLSFI